MDNEYITIPVKELTRLLDIRREHFKVCGIFNIPVEQRGEEWVGKGIIERINTYITGYIMRKSVAEKELGAAFREEINVKIQDPVLPLDTSLK